MSYNANGMFGFTFQVAQPGATVQTFTTNIVNVSSSDPGGCVWTLNLGAWLAPRGTRNATGLALPGPRARIQFGGGGGGGGGQEVVEIDYPASGAVVTFCANTVRVDIVGSVEAAPATTVSPMLSGWIAAGESTRVIPTTLTEQIENVPAGQGRIALVPARARAYRLILLGAAAQLSALQLSGNSTPIGLANDFPGDVGGGAEFQPTNRAAWFPLHPGSQTMTVSNNGAGPTSWAVQWLLELG